MTEQELPGTSQEPPVLAIMLCNVCGAPLDTPPKDGQRKTCWMCGQVAAASENPYSAYANPQAPMTVAPAPRDRRYDTLFTTLLVVCVFLAVVIGIGLGVQEPGSLIGYFILILPAFCVTGVRALWQVQQSGEANPQSLFLSLIVSFAVTVCVIVLLAFAAIALLVIMCFSQLA